MQLLDFVEQLSGFIVRRSEGGEAMVLTHNARAKRMMQGFSEPRMFG